MILPTICSLSQNTIKTTYMYTITLHLRQLYCWGNHLQKLVTVFVSNNTTDTVHCNFPKWRFYGETARTETDVTTIPMATTDCETYIWDDRRRPRGSVGGCNPSNPELLTILPRRLADGETDRVSRWCESRRISRWWDSRRVWCDILDINVLTIHNE